jgi:hypothetical protein
MMDGNQADRVSTKMIRPSLHFLLRLEVLLRRPPVLGPAWVPTPLDLGPAGGMASPRLAAWSGPARVVAFPRPAVPPSLELAGTVAPGHGRAQHLARPPGPAVGLARPQLPSACPALPLALPWLLASHRLPSTILGNNSTLQRQLFLVLIGGRRYLSNMTVSKYALLLLAVVAEVVDDHAHKSLQLLLLLPHRIVSTRLIQGISFFWILQVSHCCLSCYTHTYCWFN